MYIAEEYKFVLQKVGIQFCTLSVSYTVYGIVHVLIGIQICIPLLNLYTQLDLIEENYLEYDVMNIIPSNMYSTTS